VKRLFLCGVAVVVGTLLLQGGRASAAGKPQSQSGNRFSQMVQQSMNSMGGKSRRPKPQQHSSDGKFVWAGDHWERPKPPNTTVITDPVPQQGGAKEPFVWNGDHWERPKAPQTTSPIVTPTQGNPWATDSFPVVRDHRKPKYDVSQMPGGVAVGGGPVIRDHRKPKYDLSGVSGDVKVTSDTPIIRDHRTPIKFQGSQSVWTTSTGPVIRDHRTPKVDASGASGGVIVTGSGPIIRDHR
jgi:hypothetical protein